jgi:hypothetical protein
MSSDENSKRHDGGLHTGLARTSPYPMSRLAPAFDLVDVAREIQKADHMLTNVVGGKLDLIADQIRALQDKARVILESAERDSRLHRVECRFAKQAGSIYHLYRRPDGAEYFSILSPADWKNKPPHEFGGSFRLGIDMSWTPLSEPIG